ncbi:MAG: hypothetical protein APF77_11750 [Clostridia bacterium BRH_c25]|nr:MAG: hypothetical protein APF77_11750 [Clostridia bacterium BRH_c25]
MINKFEKQFLAIVPVEEEKEKISNDTNIMNYIYKVIVSNPNEELLAEINEIIKNVNISGIITRGSLANYLFQNNIPLPIFDLKFDLTVLMKILEKCVVTEYKRICIFEIGYESLGVSSQNIFSHNHMGDYEFYYYKMFNNIDVETTIAKLASNRSIDVLIGDVEPTLIANKYNIPVEHIAINSTSWKTTINQARHSTDISIKEKSKNNFIEIITNIMSEAVIIIDANGIIKRYNLQAEKLFFNEGNCLKIQDVFNIEIEALLSTPANYIIKIQKNNYVINMIPVILEQEMLFAIIINNIKYVQNLEMSIRTQNQIKGLTAKVYFKDIICKDAKTKLIVKIAKKYAKSNSTIIIYGESGTGKEVFASSIHNESLRANGPFVAINCASFNENLIQSELFGYEKGSFTGASSSGKKGLFEIAHNGTLFLDEIGELPLNLQAKLLRVIQEKEIMRIGGDKIIPVDVRIIAATNKDLKQMVKKNLFREDLYYRLALLEIDIPPLRDRPNDIIPLFITFLTEIAEQENKSIYWDDISIFNLLLTYDWPGNVRELKNFCERVVILSDENKLTYSFIVSMISQKHNIESTPTYTTEITDNLRELEVNYVNFLLHKFGNDKEKLCNFLNISKTTLWRKLSNS